MTEISISVRSLVEFLLRSGDIDNRHIGKATEDRMQEGSRIHRMIQKKAGTDYRAEVPLKYTTEIGEYILTVEGRADGIIENEQGVTIDEIKGTYRDVNKMKGPLSVHLAQAKCYAFMYAYANNLKRINVRMTYCNMDNEELKFFVEEYAFRTLELWFKRLMDDYRKWSDFTVAWKKIRKESIKATEFPFEYREGQKKLAIDVYSTIVSEKKLFIEAPTGVGKTISTMFPVVKAIGEDKAERFFYFTAKTVTGTVASDTLNILRNKALKMKSVVITAKEKICILEKPECNPEKCERAAGHYNRINDCMYDLLMNEDEYDKNTVLEYAKKHKVCPFELSLDMSLFCDAVICDYNYLFDPHVYLKRFFSAGCKKESLFLIDEAHNLLDRGRDMYSAEIFKEDVLKLKRSVKTELENEKPLIPKYYGNLICKNLENVNKEMLNLKREMFSNMQVDSDNTEYAPLVLKLNRLSGVISNYLEDEDSGGELRKEILDFYFVLSHFLLIWDMYDEHYRIYRTLDDRDRFMVKLFCVNPSKQLKECMDKGVSTILFSATLLPIKYFKSLLGGEKEDFEVYAHSVFDPAKRGLFIANDVTTKYTRRNKDTYEKIATYISEIVKGRSGNYMVFFPSHFLAGEVSGIFEEKYLKPGMEMKVQKEYMNEDERAEFLSSFDSPGDKTLIAFCVMGGIFAEGIDLKGESLIGAIIVGNGFPMVCPEREILKGFFDETENAGFDYAYRNPGMNKVLQAAGRVIRTASDVGIVALLDERFLENVSLRLFPREWNEYKIVNVGNVSESVKEFWNRW